MNEPEPPPDIALEQDLKSMAAELTEPREHECVLCYVYRMLEFGCSGHTWTARYRDVLAPRATTLERRLGDRGGYCDCEIFMNAYALHPAHQRVDVIGDAEFDPRYPDPLPACGGVRRGSTQPCALWIGRHRSLWR